MCLTYIIKKFSTPRHGSGFKVLEDRTFPYFPERNPSVPRDKFGFSIQPARMIQVPRGEWLDAMETVLSPDEPWEDGDCYTTGFHVITSIEAAVGFLYRMKQEFSYGNAAFEIFGVQYEGGHTLGVDRGVEIIVARRIIIDLFPIEVKRP